MNDSALLQHPSPARAPRRIDTGPTPEGARRTLAAHWPRIALAALLLATAVAYIADLSASGYANSFYAAAVQAATKSWKAFFFGSIDSSNFITVDKPPASLWVMALSGRIFGFSSASMLIPEVLEGVAAVALLYASVKRWFGSGAGLLAGAALAVTPVAALMFRFNNPDALLVLLMVAGAYCLTRALERASTRWVLAAGTMIGFAFLAKMMQAFLVLPAFAAVYMLAAPTGLRRRTAQTLAGGLAVLVSAGWWVAIVALWPTGSRPMIDGSSDNSILNLITGYNGLGRIFGATGPGGGGGGSNFSGPTGLLRLFNSEMGGQASWLIPAALIALVASLVAVRRTPRTDRTRAALVLWGGWLIVSGIVFSFGSGVIHTYYTVALAPAIAALVAIGARMAWERRSDRRVLAVTGAALVASAGWAYVLLDRTPSWNPWLRALIVACAVAALAGLVALALPGTAGAARRRVTMAVAALGAVVCLAGPVAYAADTISTAHTGSVPSAGPEAAGGGFGGGGGFASHGGFPGGGASRAGGPPSRTTGSTGVAGLFGRGGAPSTGSVQRSGGATSGGPGGGGGGGATTTSTALVSALKANASSYRWVAAVSGSQSAASLELASGGEPVMAIGGFSGQGGNLTLAQFERYVDQGAIHYYVAGGGMGGGRGGPGGGDSSSQITSWVQSHFKAVTIGGQTVYDLTQATS